MFALLIAVVSIFISFAHSGRTDASGGHRDNKNKSGLGSYHYHCGGYPAHLVYVLCNNSSSSTTRSSSGTQSSSSKQPSFSTETQKSTKVESISTAKKGFTFTATGSTNSFYKFEFKKKNDDTVYTGYILKSAVKLKTE